MCDDDAKKPFTRESHGPPKTASPPNQSLVRGLSPSCGLTLAAKLAPGPHCGSPWREPEDMLVFLQSAQQLADEREE